MKKCSKCGKEKELSEFHHKTATRLHSICKECKKEYDKLWYKGNSRRRELLNKNANIRAHFITEFIRRHKLFCGCQRCGYKKSHYSLDYHHVSDKKYQATKMKTLSIKTVKKELRKCIVLCSNCHCEIHEELNKEKMRV